MQASHSAAQTGANWFAVNTNPSAEARACLNLERQGWRTFCPKVSRTIRSGRRVKTEPRPLFPGYVFVALDLRKDAWRSVNGTFGVRTIVECGGRPSAVPEPLLNALMDMIGAGDCIDFTSLCAVGDQVRFLAGPFAHLIGSLEHLDGNGRVRVLVSLFGRETEVHARASDLIPAA